MLLRMPALVKRLEDAGEFAAKDYLGRDIDYFGFGMVAGRALNYHYPVGADDDCSRSVGVDVQSLSSLMTSLN